MATMQTFSQSHKLGKSQYELDFVDVPINKADIPLFIDPYAISKRTDYWSVDCHNAIVNFFQGVVQHIVKGNDDKAKYMLSGLREPNQTRFGLSKGSDGSHGRGVGGEQAEAMFAALSGSTAVKTGFIKDLEECELLIEGIGRDKISDITTNIIRHKLIEYTQAQCVLWNIPLQSVVGGPVWDETTETWATTHIDLPVSNARSVILVPKAIARIDIEFNHQEYYQHDVLNFIQAEHLAAGSLVRTLKSGVKKGPTKKDLKKKYPLSKSFLYDFSQKHPGVLEKYKKNKNYALTEISVESILEFMLDNPDEKKFDFSGLGAALDKIPVGTKDAGTYHDHMIGVLTAIFYPYLTNPKKEQGIHDGRKRIDISFQNSAQRGFFFELPNTKSVPSGYIFVECKNYTHDPANPELDQLSGRFSTNRGKFGLLLCRKIEDKKLFAKRCKDTADDGRGFIIALDDDDVKTLLDLRKRNDVDGLNAFFEIRYKALVM